jgi:hypothetical protein
MTQFVKYSHVNYFVFVNLILKGNLEKEEQVTWHGFLVFLIYKHFCKQTEPLGFSGFLNCTITTLRCSHRLWEQQCNIFHGNSALDCAINFENNAYRQKWKCLYKQFENIINIGQCFWEMVQFFSDNSIHTSWPCLRKHLIDFFAWSFSVYS